MCHYNRDKLSVKYRAITARSSTQTHPPHCFLKNTGGSHQSFKKKKKTRNMYMYDDIKKHGSVGINDEPIVNCTHGWQFEVRALRWAFKKADKKYHKQYTYSFKLLGNLPQYLKA